VSENHTLLSRLRTVLSHAQYVLRNLPSRLRGWKQMLMAAARLGFLSALSATVLRADGTTQRLGVISNRVVTTAGAGFLVDCLQNLGEAENINWHQSGTGTTAEAVGDTGLITATGTRTAGTQSEPSANVYRTVATLSYTSSLAITEHGVFTASTGGVLWDRSVFAAINVVNGDSIQFTYNLTVNAGG
jgi:hypothetical protein